MLFRSRLRTTPLLYFVDPENPDDLVVVASYGGHPRHPAWFHNLRAHPDTTVQVRDEVRPVHARVRSVLRRTAPQHVKAEVGQFSARVLTQIETFQLRHSRKVLQPSQRP